MIRVRTEVLVETRELSVLRLHGRPRDPETGHHRAVVVYAAATVTPLLLAGYLRELGELLEQREAEA